MLFTDKDYLIKITWESLLKIIFQKCRLLRFYANINYDNKTLSYCFPNFLGIDLVWLGVISNSFYQQ